MQDSGILDNQVSHYFVFNMPINEYLNEIRRVIELNQKKTNFGQKLFQYEVGVDELLDHSLISQRAYKTREHSDVVRIAAGASYFHEQLEQKIILLPVLAEIIRLRQEYGVNSA